MSKIRSKEAKKRQQYARQQRLKQWVYEYKTSRPCKCGESRPACLEFHHRDPELKDAEVCRIIHSHSRSRIQAEIDKCDVVCANCHRIIHAGIEIKEVAA